MNKFENKCYSSIFSFSDVKILKIYNFSIFSTLKNFISKFVRKSFHYFIFTMSTFNDSNSDDKMKCPVKAKIPRGEGSDAKRIAERLNGFNQKESIAYKFIIRRFEEGITHIELKRIAEIFAENNRLRLDRDAKRDNRVLIKWFDENWAIIGPQFYRIHMFDDQKNEIFKENPQI